MRRRYVVPRTLPLAATYASTVRATGPRPVTRPVPVRSAQRLATAVVSRRTFWIPAANSVSIVPDSAAPITFTLRVATSSPTSTLKIYVPDSESRTNRGSPAQ